MSEEFLNKYINDFNSIINITYYSVRACPVVSLKGWRHTLHTYVINTISKYGEILPLSKKEIRQELFLMWIQFSQEFKKYQPKIHIRQYLIRRSVWALRDWINAQCNQQFIPVSLVSDKQPKDIQDFGFMLDYKFLVYGTGWYPLCLLSPYERYLVFLKFVEDKSIMEISYIVQKDRLTVKQQLDGIIKDFRSRLNANKETNTRRSCSRI